MCYRTAYCGPWDVREAMDLDHTTAQEIRSILTWNRGGILWIRIELLHRTRPEHMGALLYKALSRQANEIVDQAQAL